MIKLFVPFALADNIYEIPISFFKNQKVETIICDLDNTLDAFNDLKPSDEARQLVEKFKMNGFRVIIISNNRKKRVAPYCESLNCEYIYSARKPFRGRSRKFFNELGLELSKCIFAGDQVFTDVVFANRIGLRCILCDNLVEKDQIVTKINKFFDNFIRKRVVKKKLAKSWKEM